MTPRLLLCPGLAALLCTAAAAAQPADTPAPRPLEKRWLFVWRDMSDSAEVDRMIARFPTAQAAQDHHLDLIAIVMGGVRDRNYIEGVPVRDALFVAG
jgi:hypothetical protein